MSISGQRLGRIIMALDNAYRLPGDVHIKAKLLPQPMTINGTRRLGYCKPLGVVDGLRTYEVGIVHTLDADEAVVVICHEFRHVCQYVWGWLDDHKVEGLGWNSTWHGQAHIGTEWNSPWEQDARAFEAETVEYFDL